VANQSPPSLGAQIGRTRAALSGLWRAHITLLRAEFDEILGQLKLIATQAGIALGIALMTGTLLYVGGFLFMGEWLFGSIGWGLAHGVLFGVALIVVLVMAILGARARIAVASLGLATLATIGLALLCGSNVANDAATTFARGLVAPLDSVGLVALVAGAILGALLFALLLARVGGRSGFVVGVFLGAIVGMPVGWLIGGALWTWPPAVGFAIVFGLILWPILDVVLAWPGLDPGERFKKLYPQQSIDAANETKAWLEEQWQTRRPTLGGR
jgi:hypothetical protein